MMSEAIADFEIWNPVLGQRHIGRKLALISVFLASIFFSITVIKEAKTAGRFSFGNPLTWLGSFSNGISEIAKPEILEAKVKPDKVRVGDTMTIVVKVKDIFEVKSVIADMAGIETVELKLKEGDSRQGTWEATWKVHSVKEGEYITTIIATNILGQEAFSQIKWSDPTIELLTEKTEAIWGNDSTNPDDPYHTGYEDSRAQALYFASDLTAAGMTSGTITSIQLNCYEVPGRPNLANFRIRMKLTPATTITEWEGAWTDVYGPVNTVPTAGDWQTYVLTSPFYWDGTSNLMIDISRDDTASASGGGMYKRVSVGTNRMFSGFCDSCTLYSLSSGTSNGSAKTYVPSIQITYTPDNQPPSITSVIGPPAQVNVGDDLAFDVEWLDAGIGSGASWVSATSKAQWGGRSNHSSVVYNNQMWVIGGYTTAKINDVWSSADGLSWTRKIANAQWTSRYSHASVVYNNKMWIIGGFEGVSTYRNDVWYSTDGLSWTRAVVNARWRKRSSHTSLVYNNKMWLMAGNDFGPARFNDVWYSIDGTAWTQATAAAQWRIRTDPTSVIYNNKMWIFGGYDGSTRYNDVWYSSDGISWTRATANAQWPKRDYHVSVTYNNQMWIMAGMDGSVRYNDVWYSTDGISWTQATANAQWVKRNSPTVFVYNGQVWVVGGYDGSTRYNDVWYSFGDQTKIHICKENSISGQTCGGGQTWTWCETDSWSSSSPSTCSRTSTSTDIGPQNYYAFVCDDDNFCSTTELGKTNGTFTVLSPNQAPLIESVTTSPEPVSVGEKITFDVIWSDAGDQTKIHICKTNNISDQTWTCKDESWCETDTFSTNSPTSCSSTIQMGDSSLGDYYVFVCDDDNLCSSSGLKNFIIRSPNQTPIISSATPSPNPVAVEGEVTFDVLWQDATAGSGVSWVSATSGGQWSARSGHTSLLYDGKMWVIGGYDGSGSKNDVWSSSDGLIWASATTNAQWESRSNYTSVVYNNKMWVIGGIGEVEYNDVWYSTDGISWTQQTSGAQWTKRAKNTSVVYNNKMWVIGGVTGLGATRLNDVWYSSNGVSWTAATLGAVWVAREGHSSVLYNDKMWILGGVNVQDVRWSTDGVNWPSAGGVPPWSAGGSRYEHTSLVYNGKIWMVGGHSSYVNDIWYSIDGASWTEATANAQWPGRDNHTSFVYNNQMWVLGGTVDGTTYLNDIWYSSGDLTKTHICKENSISGQTCSGTGSWCDTESTVWNQISPSSCSYTATSTDSGLRDYSAFVCDDDNLCSSPSSGSFTVTLAGQPQAIMGCDTSLCPGGECNGVWSSYRPPPNQQPFDPAPCLYALLNKSTDPNSTNPPDNNNDIIWTEWYFNTNLVNSCSGVCNYTIQPSIVVGDYTVKLRVKDKTDNWSETTHSLKVKQEVTAAFTCSDKPPEDTITWKSCGDFSNQLYEGQLLYLKDESIASAGATINSWQWKNNGNVFSTGATTFVSLLASGNTITLTVTDTAVRTDNVVQTINASYLLPEWKEIAPLSFLKLDKLMGSISRFWTSK